MRKSCALPSCCVLRRGVHRKPLRRIAVTYRTVRMRSSSGTALPTPSYNSGDGKPKTTLEEVFGTKQHMEEISVSAPWELGWQLNERNVQWIDTFKVQLIKNFAAEELGITDDAFEQRLQILTDLLPGVGPRIAQMPVKQIAQLLGQTHMLADRLLELKLIFPEADVAALLISRPSLASLESIDEISAAAQELRQLLLHSQVDVLVQRFPMLLDIEQVKESMQHLENLMPGSNFEETLQKSPGMIFSLQKGKNMIPYDEVPTSSP